MSPKCDGCAWDSCGSSAAEDKNKSHMNPMDISRTSSGISTLNNMCTSSAHKKDGLVYKRRKFHRNSVTYHISGENTSANAKGSIGCSSSVSPGNRLMVAKNDEVCKECHQENPVTISSHRIIDTKSLKVLPSIMPNDSCTYREISVLEHQLCINDRCSSSKSDRGNGSTLIKTEVEDTGECSSSDIIAEEQLEHTSAMEHTSAKELCISVLRSHGLLGGVCTSIEHASADDLYDSDKKLTQPCKVCGVLENPRKMLICDICDEAFHLSCFKPRVKKLPVNDWYCQPCLRSHPNLLIENSTGKSSKLLGEVSDYRKKRAQEDLGPIELMLKGTEAYTSGVRIGKDYQIEVLDWSGPNFEESGYFDEPTKLDPEQYASMNGWILDKPYQPNSIGNWIQCREVLYDGTNEADEGTVCGKWRRAPLFVVQTADWDCSCAVLWDPIHADCAVPQELETEVVLKHLKYIKLLRPRLANRKRNPVRRRTTVSGRRL